MTTKLLRPVTEWYLRIALSTSFLTSLGDRFGLLGQYGRSAVSWGSWPRFLGFSEKLTFWLPLGLRPAAAWASTLLELVLAGLILLPFQTVWVAVAAGTLLSIYALSLALAFGFIVSSGYSVWTAGAGAFVLALVIRARENERPSTPPSRMQDSVHAEWKLRKSRSDAN
jgi:putative oxidoreductase